MFTAEAAETAETASFDRLRMSAYGELVECCVFCSPAIGFQLET
jgi:hypothetical protein